MKKRILSLVLTLILCFSLAGTALAAETGFDATVTVDRDTTGQVSVTVSTSNNDILSSLDIAPTLSIPCDYENAQVTLDSSIITCKIENGYVIFPVTAGGTYTITQLFSVTFDAGRGISVDSQAVAYGSTATEPTVPSRYDYTFGGWYTDEEYKTAYDFTTPVTADITLYAKWIYSPVYVPDSGSSTSSTTVTNPDGSVTKTTTDSATGTVTETTTYPDGASVAVKTENDGTVTTTEKSAYGVQIVTVVNADGEVTAAVSLPSAVDSAVVTIPAADATAGTVAVIVHADGTEEIVQTCVVTEDGIVLTVEDNVQLKIVDNSMTFADVNGEWYQTAVDFVSARGIITGNTATTFAPTTSTTRAMIWTMLARLDGVDTSVGETWWSVGQQWAIANNISDGSMSDQSITREQLVTMLYRYVGSPETAGKVNSFTDAVNISDWALGSMQWAVETGILQGANNALNPLGTASRAEVAQILMNFCNYLVV